MRILLVNKFFHPRAGAETSFLHTRELLQSRGHTVIDFSMQHDENLPSPYNQFFAPERSYAPEGAVRSRVSDALNTVYSPAARSALAHLLDVHRPDVAHLHNIYHQLTLSVLDELAERRIPTVMTLHDWKVACPAYTLFTDGAPCRRCPAGTVMSAVRHRCVKSSVAASALAATEAVVARRRHSYEKVDRFVAPSRFAIEVAGLGGIHREKVTYIPNFLPDSEMQVEGLDSEAGPKLLYAGRLQEIKGVRYMLEAFSRVSVPASLTIAGSGELEGEVRAAAERDPRVHFLGMLPRAALYAELAASRAVLLPSLYEDNGPLIILEAQARAKPMIVTDRGGPPEFVRHEDTGLVVKAGHVEELAAAMERLAQDAGFARNLGRRAQRHVRRTHTATHHYEMLSGVYDAVRAGTT